MADAWRAYLDLALGLTEAPRKKAQQVAGDLLNRGGTTAAQVQGLVEDLLSTGLANREALTSIVRYEVDRALVRVGLATAEEVSDLTGRVHDLERELRAAQAVSTEGARPDEPLRPAKKTVAVKAAPNAMPAAGTEGNGLSGNAAAASVPVSAAPAPVESAPVKRAPVKRAPRKVAGPVAEVAAAPAAVPVAKKAPAKKAPAKKAPVRKAAPVKPAGTAPVKPAVAAPVKAAEATAVPAKKAPARKVPAASFVAPVTENDPQAVEGPRPVRAPAPRKAPAKRAPRVPSQAKPRPETVESTEV
ncbi:phasin family protein [Actinoplanes derwentensis]|uniref:Polyhydroxyalkanoate synthesis regulator phasin n=1 Tax=Actinoplanes derwentensis TaxID=113562 RepID=A0A1H2DBD6_9ACTN|nr:hypothetical protein [Actinoplanes derwentensis]GID88497.1 hypothetical protein Ade03nite_74210 [Actinoplanes derwentensis]SDT79909.1 Polyhydroxyalkanoate synthesis regulator phasin [Actinoplanes derwentensis]